MRSTAGRLCSGAGENNPQPSEVPGGCIVGTRPRLDPSLAACEQVSKTSLPASYQSPANYHLPAKKNYQYLQPSDQFISTQIFRNWPASRWINNL